MRIQSRLCAAAMAAAVGASVMAMSAPADAAALKYKTISCKKGGFKGEVRIGYTGRSWSGSDVREMKYRITPSNGRKNHNVMVADFGVAPTKHTKNNDNGVANGRWNFLRKKDYHRGGGNIGVRFIFDKSGDDPTCQKTYR
ncbi:hypothetical protein [Actinomadura sp. 6N118]|uniref:hypothetical protein n=1 Tax=Actinomadura sp. 6N118 TaxID=3375151 RepID=UPI00378D9C1E